jgi:hypothetical protein
MVVIYVQRGPVLTADGATSALGLEHTVVFLDGDAVLRLEVLGTHVARPSLAIPRPRVTGVAQTKSIVDAIRVTDSSPTHQRLS